MEGANPEAAGNCQRRSMNLGSKDEIPWGPSRKLPRHSDRPPGTGLRWIEKWQVDVRYCTIQGKATTTNAPSEQRQRSTGFPESGAVVQGELPWRLEDGTLQQHPRLRQKEEADGQIAMLSEDLVRQESRGIEMVSLS